MNPALQFFQEAYAELKKATWLSRKEAVGSSVAVLVLVGILSIYVASLDFILAVFLGSILGGR